MIPKNKALELCNKFLSTGMMIKQAKQCAKIAADEIMSICPYQNYKKTLCLYDGAELSADYWE